MCISGWLFSKWNENVYLLRKLLYEGYPLKIVIGSASVYLLKITGGGNQSACFEVLVCYCIIWGHVYGMHFIWWYVFSACTLFVTCFLLSVLSSKIFYCIRTENIYVLLLLSCFNMLILINAELKRLLKIPLVSSQFGNIKQVFNFIFF